MSSSIRGGLRGAKSGQRPAKRGGRIVQESHAQLSNNSKKNNRTPRGSRLGVQNAASRGSRSFTANMSSAASAIDPKDFDARWLALKQSREMERDTYDAERPRKLSEAITPVGTCMDMCPEFERVDRIRAKDVAKLERDDENNPDEAIMVKKFRKSAAGTDAQVQSDLRPPRVLSNTLDYLFNDLLDDTDSLRKAHSFLWDRTRGVRNDFSIQQVTSPEDVLTAVDCFERIARFHLLSLHVCSGFDKPYADYSAQQDREQLDKTLLSLMQYYDDNRTKCEFPNEPEFRAYCLVLAIHNMKDNIETQMHEWPRHVVEHARVKAAMQLHQAAWNACHETGFGKSGAAMAQQAWSDFWTLMQKNRVSYLAACAAETSFPHLRRLALGGMLRAFKHKQSSEDLSLEDMKTVLGASDTDEVEEIIQFSGLDVGERNDGTRFFDTHTASGEPMTSAPRPPSMLVERKRHRRTVPAVIVGMSVKEAAAQNMIDEDDMEDEEESLFVAETQPSQPTPESQPVTSIFGAVSKAPHAPANNTPVFGPSSNAGFGNSMLQTKTPLSNPNSSVFGVSSFGNFSPATSPFGNPSPATDAKKKSVKWDPSVAPTTFGSTSNTTAAVFGSVSGGLDPSAPAFGPSASPTGPTQAEKEQKAEEARSKAAEVEKEQNAEREREALAKMERERQEQEQEQARKEQEQKAIVEAARQRALLEQAELQARREAAEVQAQKEQEEREKREAELLRAQQAAALDLVTEQLVLDENGILDMFIEHVGESMFDRAQATYASEAANREADHYRECVLMLRYGARWREVAYSKRLHREAIERRHRAKRARAAAAATESRRLDVMTQFDDFKKSRRPHDIFANSIDSNDSSVSQPSNKENDPNIAVMGPSSGSESLRHAQRRARNAGNHAQFNSDFGASILTNNLTGATSTESTPHDQRPNSPFSLSHSSRSAARSSQMGLRYGEFNDTTISPYFRMKAKLGKSMPESAYYPNGLRSTSGGKRGRAEHHVEEDFDHSHKRLRSDASQPISRSSFGLDFSRNELSRSMPENELSTSGGMRSSSERKHGRADPYSEEDLDRLKKRFQSSRSQPTLGSSFGSNTSRHGPAETPFALADATPNDQNAVSEEEEDADPLFASIRRANKVMAEGTQWFRETVRSYQNTPVTPPSPQESTRRHSSSGTHSHSASKQLRSSRFLGRPSKAERDLKKQQEARREEKMLHRARERAKEWHSSARERVERQNALAEAEALADQAEAEERAACRTHFNAPEPVSAKYHAKPAVEPSSSERVKSQVGATPASTVTTNGGEVKNTAKNSFAVLAQPAAQTAPAKSPYEADHTPASSFAPTTGNSGSSAESVFAAPAQPTIQTGPAKAVLGTDYTPTSTSASTTGLSGSNTKALSAAPAQPATQAAPAKAVFGSDHTPASTFASTAGDSANGAKSLFAAPAQPATQVTPARTPFGGNQQGSSFGSLAAGGPSPFGKPSAVSASPFAAVNSTGSKSKNPFATGSPGPFSSGTNSKPTSTMGFAAHKRNYAAPSGNLFAALADEGDDDGDDDGDSDMADTEDEEGMDDDEELYDDENEDEEGLEAESDQEDEDDQEDEEYKAPTPLPTVHGKAGTSVEDAIALDDD